jgi:eukaryotic-like serine/threonine-protein kinase
MTQASERADPFGWVGSVIDGRYRVDEVVGEGGFGVVYAGRHLGFDEAIAIKCLKLDDAIPSSKRNLFLKGFIAEGRILYRLSQHNPYIVRAIDVGAATSPDGVWTPYLVLEWVRGGTLEDEIAQRVASGHGGRSIREALDLLEPAARALDAAHAEGIAHRDVKPSNLLLTDVQGQRTLKVLDFGVAKVMGAAAGPGAVTTPGTLIRAFSPSYGAPEQFDSKYGSTGPWTDVFALALVFVQVVLGRRAYDGEDDAHFFVQATNPARRPTLRSLGHATSDDVERVLQRALAVDPRNRFGNAGEFWDALGGAVHGRTGAARGPGGGGTVESDAPVRTEVPEHPITIPGAPAPTMTQVPPLPLTIVGGPSADLRRAAYSRAGTTARREKNTPHGKRRILWVGVVVVGLAVVAAGAVVGAEIALPEFELWGSHSPAPPSAVHSPVPPVLAPPPPTRPLPPPVATCEQPCCGGVGCMPESKYDTDMFEKNFCTGPGCACGSGLACVPGACKAMLRPGDRFELRMAGIYDSKNGTGNACKTDLRSGRVCVRTKTANLWRCARVEDACSDEAGAEVGGVRIGPAGMVVTTEDLTQDGLEVVVESSADERLACLDNGRHRERIHIIGECVGIRYGGLRRSGGAPVDAVSFYALPAKGAQLAPDVSLDQAPGSTEAPPCMRCAVNAGGDLTCDSSDARCARGCFTHSD